MLGLVPSGLRDFNLRAPRFKNFIPEARGENQNFVLTAGLTHIWAPKPKVGCHPFPRCAVTASLMGIPLDKTGKYVSIKS
jgi:hypothetical protein